MFDARAMLFKRLENPCCTLGLGKYIGPFESSQAVVATKKAHGASSTTAEEYVLQGKAERNGASIQVVGITALWRLECHHGNPRRWFGHSRRAEGQRAIFTRQPIIGQPKANCSREAQDEFHIRYGCHYRVVVFPGHGAISTSQACNSSVSLGESTSSVFHHVDLKSCLQQSTILCQIW